MTKPQATILFRSLIATIFVAWSSVGFAQEIIVWQPVADGPQIVLPLLKGETPHQAVDRYYESMESNADMKREFASHRREDPALSVFSKLAPLAINDRARVLVQANEAHDLVMQDFRMSQLLDVMDHQKSEAFILPPAAVLRLSAQQQYRFQDALYDQFDMRKNIGGDDVHPAEYGQPITWARKEELNRTRDKFEIQLIRHWQMRNDRALASGLDGKPEFGICRGHQIMAVASGHSMIQDNVRDGASKDGTHLDRLGNPSLRSVQHWHHVYVVDSLFAELLGAKGKVMVNDWHHQSVKVNPLARTRVVAVAPDGVVEALESADRLTMSVQFHPEFTAGQSGNVQFSTMGHKLLGGIYALARTNRIQRECTSVFRVAQ